MEYRDRAQYYIHNSDNDSNIWYIEYPNSNTSHIWLEIAGNITDTIFWY